MTASLREKIVEAWYRLGNKTHVAEELGINRTTVRKHLKAEGIGDQPLATGRLSYIEAEQLPLPEPGEVARYILTAAQNNTKVHDGFFDNLVTYAQHLGARLMVSRFTYNKASYANQKSVAPGHTPTAADKQDAWWDPRLSPYVCNDPLTHGDCRYQLAPGLVFCAEMNILPTAARPLSGLHSYSGRDSGIFPHAKIAMESVASMKNEDTKFNYTTGAVTKRNYIKKKTGLMAEFHHAYGALIVEVMSDGSWWVRQLNGDKNGAFYDCPDLGEPGAAFIHNGIVTLGHPIEAVNWGDVHASEIDEDVASINWGDENSIIDVMRPRYQFMHDILSFRSRSHHEIKSFGKMFEKWLSGEESVDSEIEVTARTMNDAERDFCEQIVVSSNHDRHGERWLDEADYRKDPVNAEFFLEAQLERVRAMKAQVPWDFATWSLKKYGAPKEARFLAQDESFVICKRFGGGIECGMHGDEGPNGARGTTMNLRKLGRRVNKGHDHQATIIDGVYSAGACQLNFGYATGPSSHSISHIFTYPNGKRAIVTVWNNGWRAGQT